MLLVVRACTTIWNSRIAVEETRDAGIDRVSVCGLRDAGLGELRRLLGCRFRIKLKNALQPTVKEAFIGGVQLGKLVAKPDHTTRGANSRFVPVASDHHIDLTIAIEARAGVHKGFKNIRLEVCHPVALSKLLALWTSSKTTVLGLSRRIDQSLIDAALFLLGEHVLAKLEDDVVLSHFLSQACRRRIEVAVFINKDVVVGVV